MESIPYHCSPGGLIHIRPANPQTDIAGITEVVNTFETVPVPREVVAKWFEHNPPGRISQRLVLIAEDTVAGYSVVTHEAWEPQGHFYLWAGLHPRVRGQGWGQALYDHAQSFLETQGWSRIKTEILDHDPIAWQFAQKNGFHLERHRFSSRLDLLSFSEAPYAGLIPRQEAAGIRFFSLADLDDSPAARQRLYDLNRITGADIPGATGPYMSFAEFEAWVCDPAWYTPAGQLIAADGEEWVGLAAVQLMRDTNGAHNLMTGVLRPWRGRGIALALKILAIRFARTQGATFITTRNDSQNAPVLAINRKLGYLPQPGTYEMVRTHPARHA